MWKSTILLIFRGYFGVVRTCPVTGPPFSLQFFLLKVRRRWWEEKMLELIIWLRRKSWGSNTSRRKWKREKIREEKRILWSEWRLYLPKLEWSILRVLGGLPTSKLFLFLFRISFSHSFSLLACSPIYQFSQGVTSWIEADEGFAPRPPHQVVWSLSWGRWVIQHLGMH